MDLFHKGKEDPAMLENIKSFTVSRSLLSCLFLVVVVCLLPVVVLAALPTIENFSPDTGVAGDVVFITGTDLDGTTDVEFTDGISIPVLFASSTQIAVNVPTGVTTGPIKVSAPIEGPFSTMNFTVPNVHGISFSNVAASAINGFETGLGGRAIAWIDYDNDGLQDLFVTGAGRLYHNEGAGQFVDVTAGSPDIPVAQGAAVGDYDADGFDDIYVTRNFLSDRLLRNSPGPAGTRIFVDVTDSGPGGVPSGITGNENKRGESAAFGDLNGDGFLDIYVANNDVGSNNNPGLSCGLPEQNDMYINNRDGTFTKRTDLGAMDGGCAWATALTDYDQDGDLDIFVINDIFLGFTWLPGSELYRNDLDTSGTFNPLGLNIAIAGMGIAVGDINNDGALDYYQTDIGPGTLSRGDGAGGFFLPDKFEDAHSKVGWGTIFLDADNDGFIDLYKSNTGLSAGNTGQMNMFFINNGDDSFSQDVASLVGVDGTNQGRGVARADYDNDGRIDFATVGGSNGIELFHNVSSDTNNWITVNLVGDPPNHRGIGATVLADLSDGKQLMREINSGSSLSSTNAFPAHFGLGTASVNSVTVRWPGNCQQTVTGLSVNQTINVVHADACAKISSFTPATGSAGDFVTINGTNLDGATDVQFNGISTSVLFSNATVVFVFAPAGVSTGPIKVITPQGSYTSLTDFELPLPPVPRTLSGTVSVGGVGLEGVLISVVTNNTGPGASTTTGPGGVYSVELAPNGYLVTPSKTGYTFVPMFKPIIVNEDDIVVNFKAIPG